MLSKRNPSGFGLCYKYHIKGTAFRPIEDHLETLKKDLTTLSWKPEDSIYHSALDFTTHAPDTSELGGGNGIDSAYGIVFDRLSVKPYQTLYVIFGMHKRELYNIPDKSSDNSVKMKMPSDDISISERRRLRRQLRLEKSKSTTMKEPSDDITMKDVVYNPTYDITMRDVVYNPIYHYLFHSLKNSEKKNDAKNFNDVKNELIKLYSNEINEAGQVKPLAQPWLFTNLRKRYCSIEHKRVISEITKTQSIYEIFKLLTSTSFSVEYQPYHRCILVILLHSSELKNDIQNHYLKDLIESAIKIPHDMANLISSYLDAKQEIPEISDAVLPKVFNI